MTTTYYVHVKMTGAKRAMLLTTGGGLTGLKVHAARFEEKGEAERIAAEVEAQNPGKLTAHASLASHN